VSEPSTPRVSVGTLLRRIWQAICAHKALVAAFVLLGVLETAFSKLPMVLIKPLGSVMTRPGEAPQALGPEAEWGDRFNQWFQAASNELATALGIGFTGEHAQQMNTVLGCAFVAVICGIAGAACIYFLQIVSRYFAIKMVADLRVEMARHILNLPLRFFGSRRMGDLISKVTNDAGALQRSFELVCDNIVVDPLMILGNVVILAWFVPEALYVMAVMIPFFAIPIWRQGKRVRRRSQKSLAAMGDAMESMNQILSGIRTVKAFQLEAQRQHEYEDNNRTFLKRTVQMLRAKAMAMAQTFVAYQVGFAFLLLLLGWVVLVERTLKFEDVALVIAPLTTTYQHVKRLTRSISTLQESTGALDGIEEILGTPIDDALRGGRKLGAVRGEVELRDVWFRYGEEPVLRGLDLKVPAGTTVALVGPSGGGKSTTLDVLMRFHDPERGSVLVDGVDLKDVNLADYRSHTAVVSQQPFLFNDTIRANIACGKPGCTQSEVEAAARAANIHDFIVSQPLGYDTMAGERGCNLSGGQMQRITIARAIVRNPAILFLDEATSALDSENEELVQRALDNLRKGRTSFVIAHRLSTIVSADMIVVLDQGRVVEVGTHAELLARGGAYKRMHELQAG